MTISSLSWSLAIFLETLTANLVTGKTENIQDPTEFWVNVNGEGGHREGQPTGLSILGFGSELD